MRAIVQRCAKASVSVLVYLVDNDVISSIGQGICVLIGISRDDTKKDMEYIVRKLLNLRIFEDDNGTKWAKSVKDKQYEILCVSQFTLYGTLKGNKPDFRKSMASEKSQNFYAEFINAMKEAYCEEHVKDGKFGAYMQVSIQNDGPVTIDLESPDSKKKDQEVEENT